MGKYISEKEYAELNGLLGKMSMYAATLDRKLNRESYLAMAGAKSDAQNINQIRIAINDCKRIINNLEDEFEN